MQYERTTLATHSDPAITAMPQHQPIIAVEHLVKRYKRATSNAVDNISFAVPAGTFFALLGPNGAGKTTTISILTTTLLPTTGTVHIAGYDLARQASKVRNVIGIIFQKPSLDINLTAEENIRFHAALYGLYPFRPTYLTMSRAYREQVERLAVILGIQENLFTPVKKYSGGMKRKLEILRSLLHNPKVLFLDEPTAGLDPSSRRSLWEYLRKVRIEQGVTIFLTTHYLEEAEQADTLCVINKGKIVSYGTPAEIKAQLVEEYLLLDADNRASLHDELQQRGIAFDDLPPFKVRIEGSSVHALLKSIDTPLTLVETHIPSLEDAYLEIIGEKGEQDA